MFQVMFSAGSGWATSLRVAWARCLPAWAKGLKSESLWMPPGLPVSAKSLSEDCFADFSSRSGDDWS